MLARSQRPVARKAWLSGFANGEQEGRGALTSAIQHVGSDLSAQGAESRPVGNFSGAHADETLALCPLLRMEPLALWERGRGEGAHRMCAVQHVGCASAHADIRSRRHPSPRRALRTGIPSTSGRGAGVRAPQRGGPFALLLSHFLTRGEAALERAEARARSRGPRRAVPSCRDNRRHPIIITRRPQVAPVRSSSRSHGLTASRPRRTEALPMKGTL